MTSITDILDRADAQIDALEAVRADLASTRRRHVSGAELAQLRSRAEELTTQVRETLADAIAAAHYRRTGIAL